MGRSEPGDKEYQLLWHLCGCEEFRADLPDFELGQLLSRYPWSFIEAALESSNTSILDDSLQLDQIRAFRDGVVKVAAKYLRTAAWGPEAIHRWAFDMVRGFTMSRFHAGPVQVKVSELEDAPFAVDVHVRIRPYARWHDIEEALSDYRTEITAALKKERPHYRLDPHLMWLAGHLAGKPYKQVHEEYAAWLKKTGLKKTGRPHFPGRPVTDVPQLETIRKGAQRAAHTLGIDLRAVRRTPS